VSTRNPINPDVTCRQNEKIYDLSTSDSRSAISCKYARETSPTLKIVKSYWKNFDKAQEQNSAKHRNETKRKRHTSVSKWSEIIILLDFPWGKVSTVDCHFDIKIIKYFHSRMSLRLPVDVNGCANILAIEVLL
jgi:hypothetical protein